MGVSYTTASPTCTSFPASPPSAAPMSATRSLTFSLDRSASASAQSRPLAPLWNRTGAYSARAAPTPPNAPTWTKPFSSMWVATNPMESIWAENITRGPLPFLRQIRFPITSREISST